MQCSICHAEMYLGNLCPNCSVDKPKEKADPPPPCASSCAKCGSKDVHRKYYEPGADTNGPWPNRGKKSSAWVNRKDAYFQPAIHECIVHTCRTCGYSWDSEPLLPKPTA